jgi:hypothetical protein
LSRVEEGMVPSEGNVMERIEVTASTEQLTGRYFLNVNHSETRLDHGLELAERVVLADATGGFRAATVEELDFGLEDTVYRFRLGAVLPPDLAAERVSGVPLSRDRQSIHDVVDLIGELRGSVVGG